MRAIILSVLLLTGPAWASNGEADQNGSPTEAPITLKPPSGSDVKEFRVNGRLYMIMVQPSKGLSYFLVDTDGDGDLETRRDEHTPEMLIPAWVLRRW